MVLGMDGVCLYPEPVDVLRSKLEYLQSRLRVERAEVDRFRLLRVEQGRALDGLVSAAEEDAAMTLSLVKDYKAAIRVVGS